LEAHGIGEYKIGVPRKSVRTDGHVIQFFVCVTTPAHIVQWSKLNYPVICPAKIRELKKTTVRIARLGSSLNAGPPEYVVVVGAAVASAATVAVVAV
jgi:hypothetical protein